MPQENQAAGLTGIVDISDMDTLVRALVHWHTNRVATINHMKSIPEGTEVSVDDGPPMKLEGDLLTGFQLGLAFAISEIGELPFTFTLEDDEPKTAGAVAGAAQQH